MHTYRGRHTQTHKDTSRELSELQDNRVVSRKGNVEEEDSTNISSESTFASKTSQRLSARLQGLTGAFKF